MDNLILSPIPLDQLLNDIRKIVREEQQAQDPKTSDTSQPLISEKELCEKLGISLPTAGKWRVRGRIPYVRVGRSVRYDLSKVLIALDSRNQAKRKSNSLEPT